MKQCELLFTINTEYIWILIIIVNIYYSTYYTTTLQFSDDDQNNSDFGKSKMHSMEKKAGGLNATVKMLFLINSFIEKRTNKYITKIFKYFFFFNILLFFSFRFYTKVIANILS